MARLAAGKLFHIVNDHLGTPKEMFFEGGNLAWSVDHDTWGTVRRVAGAKRAIESGDYWVENVACDPGAQAEPAAMLCPIRFQGQWEDAETGLYYNRFRYYEPLAEQYLSVDPLHLKGSDNTSAYVVAPSSWVDPLGLSGCNTPKTVYHYTTEEAINAILGRCRLKPSTKARNPSDARYGDGQHFSDIIPGTKTNAQLSRAFINNLFQGSKFDHFIAIDSSRLNVVCG